MDRLTDDKAVQEVAEKLGVSVEEIETALIHSKTESRLIAYWIESEARCVSLTRELQAIREAAEGKVPLIERLVDELVICRFIKPESKPNIVIRFEQIAALEGK